MNNVLAERVLIVQEKMLQLAEEADSIMDVHQDELTSHWDEFTKEQNLWKVEHKDELVALLQSNHDDKVLALAQLIVLMSYKIKCSRYNLLEAIKNVIENNY